MKQDLFVPYRVLGVISDDAPSAAFQSRATANYAICSIEGGRTFQIYDLDKAERLFTGPSFSEPPREAAATTTPAAFSQGRRSHRICHLASFKDYTFVGFPGALSICERATEERYIPLGDDPQDEVRFIEAFETFILVIQASGRLSQISLDTYEVMSSFSVLLPGQEAEKRPVVSVLHPNTYVNKVLVATQTTLSLWNTRTGKLIYDFKEGCALSQPIVQLHHSPVLDVVVLALADGSLVFYNIREDHALFTLPHADGAVTSLAFRRDETGHLATGNAMGDVTIWDLTHKKIMQFIKGAHDRTVHSLFYLPGQPVLVSIGADNALKQWIQGGDGSAALASSAAYRLHKFRSGHAQPPAHLAFYDPTGQYILSAGADRSFRVSSTYRDAQNGELSQGASSKTATALGLASTQALKHAPITHFSACYLTRFDWDNALTSHVDEPFALTWSVEQRRLGSHKLAARDGSTVRTVLVTPCGNYGVLGCASGAIDVYNMQSGLFQFSLKGHTHEVTSLHASTGSKFLISTSLDASIKVWDFCGKKLQKSIALDWPCSKAVFYEPTDCLAVALDDFSIEVYDLSPVMAASALATSASSSLPMQQLHKVRQFASHGQPITAMAFSGTGGWLVAAYLDKALRVYDLVAATCLATLPSLTGSVITSLAFSPQSAESLIVSCADSVGLHQLVSAAFYAPQSEPLPPSASDAAIEDANVAHTQQALDKISLFRVSEADTAQPFIQISDPSTQLWQRLLNIDLIKERNKPKEPPKKPKALPFFLNFDEQPSKADTEAADGSVASHVYPASSGSFSELETLLQADKYVEYHEGLKVLNPALLDAEIRVLSEPSSLAAFMRYITLFLEQKRDYDLVQSFLNIFLKSHFDVLTQPNLADGTPNSALPQQLSDLLTLQQTVWRDLERLMQESLCVTNLVKSRV